MSLIGRLLREHVAPHARVFVVRFLLAAAIAASPFAFSFLGKWLVDEALQVTGPPKVQAEDSVAQAGPAPPVGVEWKARTTEEKLRLLAIFLAASVGIHVAATALSALSELLNSRTVQQMSADLRTAVHTKIERLDMGLFGQEKVGQLMTRTLDDTAAIPGNLTNLVINTATQLAMLVLGLVLLVRLNPAMTLVPLVALPFYAAACFVFLPRLRRNAEEVRNRFTAFTGNVIERLTNMLTIKNYAQEDRELARFGAEIEQNQALGRQQQRLSLYFNTATTLIAAASTLAVLAIGFLNIKGQRMQLGEVLAFHQVTAQLFVPISALVSMATVAQTLRMYAGRVYGILDMETTVSDLPDVVELPEPRGEMALENVSLRYQEGGPFAVRDVSLAIPAGSSVCIVGPTGCGKSTVLALLGRLYDPTDGVVRFDGVDVRRLRVRRVRRAVGTIPRDCDVFAGTFGDNLRFGAPQATQEGVEAVARRVGLHDFIASQPDGYETRTGHQGLTLSDEQLVRLAVARALITQPPVVTVDDAFYALDEDVEALLWTAIRDGEPPRTLVVATSRLAMCERADRVVVMQKGSVVQLGTHTELLATPGVYRRMYMRQMGMDALG